MNDCLYEHKKMVSVELPLNSVKRKLVGLFFLRTPSGQVLCDTGGTAI